MSVNYSARSECTTRIMFSIFFNMKVCCVFPLELHYRGDSNEYTQYTIFNLNEENHPKLSQICSQGIFFQVTQALVGNNHGERAVSV